MPPTTKTRAKEQKQSFRTHAHMRDYSAKIKKNKIMKNHKRKINS